MKTSIVLLFTILLFSGCGDKPKKNPPQKSEPDKIQNWARPGVQGQMSGAYFVYTNPLNIADTLISVYSPQAMMTQIHESYTTEDGLAGMREKKEIVVHSDETLVLKQGGLHVMLMNLKKDLSENDSVEVALEFTKAGTVKLKLPVKNNK
ncbi:MAG: copper chaperone PCu(A)C [Balneola sp.]